MKRSLSPVEDDFVDEERPTFKLSRGTSKFVLHRHLAFLRYNNRRGQGNLTFGRGSVWKSGSSVYTLILTYMHHRHSTIDSRESQFRSSPVQICTTEWRAFCRSVQESIICYVQNQVKSWTGLSSCRGSDHMSSKGQAAAALFMDSSMNSGLDFSSFRLVLSPHVLYWCEYMIM